ncbi:MAG: CHAT domain-containing protein, partial [Rhodococcus sp.]|uniref:CHAT domain-containing protein n=2 Tax=Rhodococcus TaxID=1827 RepID=UPI0016920A2E
AYLDELYGCVEQLWDRHRHRSTATERHRAFESDLARYGLELGARLLPDALRGDLAAAWQMLTGLTIVTTETDIPWELVCIDVHGGRRRFLGETGMTRWFCGGTHPTALPLRRGHRRYLCPEYSSPKWQLQHLSDERALLGGTLDADEITPGSADDLGAVLGGRDVDLLHFGGHGDVAVRDGAPQPRLLLRGFSDRTPPDPSAVYSADRVRSDLPRPSPPDPESGSVPRHRPGPLVVLNACRAGRTIRTGTDAFAPSLLSGGAGAVLCCLWQVQDDTAAKFVRTFYSALTHSATVSAALTTARRAARDDGNASWLAYALYAHPFATVDLESP